MRHPSRGGHLVWPCFRSHRTTLFHLLHTFTLRSTTQDRSLEEAIAFLQERQGRTGTWLPIVRMERTPTGEPRPVPLLDLSWIPDGWWRLVTGERTRDQQPQRVDRRHFEACVFSQILWELNSGDLCIAASDAFADHRSQQISWEEYHAKIAAYSAVVGLPLDGPSFVAHLRTWLEDLATRTDRAFPANKTVRIEQGEPMIARAVAPPPPGRTGGPAGGPHETDLGPRCPGGDRPLAGLAPLLRADLRVRCQD